MVNMTMERSYAAVEPARSEIDALSAPVLVEFGAPWCGFCQAAQEPLAEAMAQYPQVMHFKIEDGKGRRLGRSFGVKLWPTLVFMNGGKEVARLVRPDNAGEIRDALKHIAAE